MLDIKFIRENVDIVKMAATKKKIKVDIDRLILIDNKRRDIMQRLESKRAEQNKISDGIPTAVDGMVRQQLIVQMQSLKAEIQTDEEAIKLIMEEWQSLMLKVPNIPDMTVPDGDSDADNEEIKTWGEKTTFPFDAKDHVELML
jgi:seryl-tRNA synthetase